MLPHKIPDKPTECDACASEPIEYYNNLWLCEKCLIKEKDSLTLGWVSGSEEINIPSRAVMMQMGTLPVSSEVMSVIEKARKIDNSLITRFDFFNAETVSFKEVEDSIPLDTPNRPFVLAKFAHERFEKYQELILSKNEELVELRNKQLAAQKVFNELANQITAEERGKFKIRDLNYQPKEVKKIKEVKLPKGTNKPDKDQIRIACTNLSIELHKPIPEFMLQMICISKNLSVAEGANFLRRQIQEASSENN